MVASAVTRDRHQYPLAGLLNLLVTYVVWGSTYLAIRVAVREGAGWGPFWLGGSRVAVAALVLFTICWFRGVRLKPTRAELGIVAATGVLMWVAGNGGVNWAEQRVDSGLAALIVGTMPIWVALMESLIDRRKPSLLLAFSLAVGFGGLVALTYPMLRDGVGSDFFGVIVIVLAALSWGIGSIVINRRPVALDPIVISAWQQLSGSIGFTAVALLAGETAPHPTPEAWGAWAYLVVFGSLLAYTSFVYAIKLLPATVVMTYAYVNPVIAVLLGWLILSEPITGYTLVGMVLIVCGVYGVFRDKGRRSAPSE
jgi:drug/metabolite transporter (DMT)-like permease